MDSSTHSALPGIPIDHLVFATPDLDRGIDEIDDLLGVRPVVGGRHPGRGTRNALLALGSDVYLEIVAPDPEQSDPPGPRAFGLDGLREAKLTAWAAKTSDVDGIRARASSNGIVLGEAQGGRRQRPDGIVLSWRFTDPAIVSDGLIPFFIDWGRSPHPAAGAPQGGTLVVLRAEHPDPDVVQHQLQVLGIHMPVSRAPKAALIAIVDGPRGSVSLR